jgi:uncharacterized protein (TIGR02452 family)
MSLADVAGETLSIIERGAYRAPSGRTVALRDQIDAAVSGTTLYTPDDLAALVAARPPEAPHREQPAHVEVTPGTTAQAARRLTLAETTGPVAALNFASARRPGGGFLTGARAQEEDLARCSALYPCLIAQRPYYEANRAHPSAVYTHHVIYSPNVPFFRDDRLELLEEPFLVSVVTAPAPNAGAILGEEPDAGPRIRSALEERAAMVLAVAAEQGCRHLVLGAWGCGVFRNDPAVVAEVFATWLAHPSFSAAFDHVVFAVHDRSSGQPVLSAFQRQFGG